MPWVSRIGRLAGTESRQERKADEVAVALPAAGGVGRLAEPVGLVQPYGRQLPGIARAGGHPRGAGSRGGAAGGVPRRRARRTGRPAGRAGSLRPSAYRQLPGASGRPALRCRGRGRRLASGVPRGAAGQPGDPPGAGAPAASRAGPAAAPAPQATGGAGVPEPLAVDRLAFHPPGARRASRAPGSAGHPPPTNRTTATTSTCSATTPAKPASATASAPSYSATRASSSAPRRRSTWASITRRR